MLKERLTRATSTISELTGFRDHALARLTAQHDEITRLRRHAGRAASVWPLPARTTGTGPCS